MGAGLSQKQINSRIYNRLQTIKRQLEQRGVSVFYGNHSLCRNEVEGSQKIGSFNIRYDISRASNGETAGFPQVYITGALRDNGTYGWQKEAGSFDKGIEKIIEIFSEMS
jgi:hypothetical protein